MGKKTDDFWRKEYKKFLETTKSNPTKGGGSVISESTASSIFETFFGSSTYPYSSGGGSGSGTAVGSGSGYWPPSTWWTPPTFSSSSSTFTSVGHVHVVVTKCHWSDDGTRLYIDEWDNNWDSCGDPPPDTTFRSDEAGMYLLP